MSSSTNPFTSIPRRSTPPPSIRRVTPPPSPTLPSTAKQVSEQILTDPVTTLQHLGVDDASNAAPGKLPAFAIPAGLAVTDGIGEGDGNGTVGSVGGQTLSLLLKPVVEEITEEAQQEYAAFHSVAKWMMGSTQSTLPYYAMYPPIMRSYQISLPALSDIPRTDLGRGPISIDLRRAALLVACIQYQGYYCAITAASVGDIARGSWRAQAASLKKQQEQHHHPRQFPFFSFGSPSLPSSSLSSTSSSSSASSSPPIAPFTLQPASLTPAPLPAPPSNPFTNPFTPSSSSTSLYSDPFKPNRPAMDTRANEKERDALLLVTAATRIPGKVTPELKRKVIKGLRIDGLQCLATLIGMIGFTNVLTDLLGIEISLTDFEFAKEYLGTNSDWKVAQHVPTVGFDRETGVSDVEVFKQQLKEERAKKTGFKRILEYASLIKDLALSASQSATWLTAIPSTSPLLNAFLHTHLGFTPLYFSSLKSVEQLRSLVHMTWVFLLRDRNAEPDSCVEHQTWENWEKAVIWGVFARGCGDKHLEVHAAFTARRFGCSVEVWKAAARVGVEEGERYLDGSVSGGPSDTVLSKRLHLAILLTLHSASTMDRHYPPHITTALYDYFRNSETVMEATPHAAVLEVIGTLAFVNAVHRMAPILVPDPCVFEVEIGGFVEDGGDEWGVGREMCGVFGEGREGNGMEGR